MKTICLNLVNTPMVPRNLIVFCLVSFFVIATLGTIFYSFSMPKKQSKSCRQLDNALVMGSNFVINRTRVESGKLITIMINGTYTEKELSRTGFNNRSRQHTDVKTHRNEVKFDQDQDERTNRGLSSLWVLLCYAGAIIVVGIPIVLLGLTFEVTTLNDWKNSPQCSSSSLT